MYLHRLKALHSLPQQPLSHLPLGTCCRSHLPGSSGAYFKKADVIVQMDEYKAYDITKTAKEQAQKFEGDSGNKEQPVTAEMPDFDRCMLSNRNFYDDRTKIKVNALESVSINKNTIDMRASH